MIDYKDKIKKLLALSTSPYEAEATAALLKARELMAKYKIEQFELEDNTDENLVSVAVKDIPFHARKDLWVNDLCVHINKYFPVVVSSLNPYLKKTRYPVVSGFANDVEIAVQVMRYIYDSVGSWANEFIKDSHIVLSASERSKIRFSYGLGFCSGWGKALQKQNEENPEWGLALVKPDVSSVVRIEGEYKAKCSIKADRNIYSKGINDGFSYGSQKRLH